jgi:hypothetical protein
MPNITADELQRLSGLLRDIDATTLEIRRRSDAKQFDAKALCDNLKKHTDLMFSILNDVNSRQTN